MIENLDLFEKTKKKKSLLDPEEITREIFSCHCLKKDRYKQVLIRRYGLFGSPQETLASIGKEFKITRERVRQIEEKALKKLKNPECGVDHSKNLNLAVLKFLDKNGGFASQEKLIRKFVKNKSQSKKNAFLFLLQLNKKAIFIKENSYHVDVWVSNDELGLHAKYIIERAHEFLNKRGKATPEKDLLKNLKSDSKKNILILNILESAKLLAKVEDENLWGLKTWSDINPRYIKDKAFVVMKKLKTPMHFREITEKINSYFTETKKVTAQSVHNEIIKDQRFVLIGKGIYALSEWGYKRGLVEDVIAEILNEAKRPLHKNEIVERVLEKRIVKESTIILNLQKERFKRVRRAIYTLNDF